MTPHCSTTGERIQVRAFILLTPIKFKRTRMVIKNPSAVLQAFALGGKFSVRAMGVGTHSLDHSQANTLVVIN